MQALTLTPGMTDSLELREVPDPLLGEGRRCAAAAATPVQADAGWLARLITRRVALASSAGAFAPRSDDVKVVLEMKER